MKRRDFIKLSIFAGTAIMMNPTISFGADIDISKVDFDANSYQNNKAQVIMVFLYGGPSELAGNLSNFDEIKNASQSDYNSHFGAITPTVNKFWQEAGGDLMEDLINSGDLNLFRTCYSKQRDEKNNKAHGVCVSQNARASFEDESPGMFSLLAKILEQNGVIDKNTVLPFITMEGETPFYAKDDLILSTYLNPVAFDANLNNPYKRDSTNRWFYYTRKEREVTDYHLTTKASLNKKMDDLAQSINKEGQIKEAFTKRESLSDFVDQISTKALPDGITYPQDNNFGDQLKTAINILSSNPDTKVISLGSGGLGGWDDHSEAIDYVSRSRRLFEALSSAMAHIKAQNRENEISIVVFGDFGRNVNLNSGFGWDHGNNQNLYILGGKNYFNSVGVVGETELYNPNKPNRLFLKPKADSYQFEPLCVGATIYKIFGIQNPEVLTGGYGAIEGGLL